MGWGVTGAEVSQVHDSSKSIVQTLLCSELLVDGEEYKFIR